MRYPSPRRTPSKYRRVRTYCVKTRAFSSKVCRNVRSRSALMFVAIARASSRSPSSRSQSSAPNVGPRASRHSVSATANVLLPISLCSTMSVSRAVHGRRPEAAQYASRTNSVTSSYRRRSAGPRRTARLWTRRGGRVKAIPRRFRIITSRRRSRSSGTRAVLKAMRLVDHDEVPGPGLCGPPMRLPFRGVHRCDQEGPTLPVAGRAHDLERQGELRLHLLPPLRRQRGRREDERPAHQAADRVLLQDEARLDRLPQADLVREDGAAV